jgi:hypothetical protein
MGWVHGLTGVSVLEPLFCDGKFIMKVLRVGVRWGMYCFTRAHFPLRISQHLYVAAFNVSCVSSNNYAYRATLRPRTSSARTISLLLMCR